MTDLAQRLDALDHKLNHLHELLHNLIERQADEKDLLRDILERTIRMSAETERLTASVAALTTAEQSAVALLGQLSQLIRDNATDPAALTKLADDIDADTAEIAAAVVANTPASAPQPPAEPAA